MIIQRSLIHVNDKKETNVQGERQWRAGRNPSSPPPFPTHKTSRAATELKKTTQLQQLAAMTDPKDERLYPFSELAAPWRCTNRDYGERLKINRTNGWSKDEAALQHVSNVRRLHTREHLLVYTDGSQRDIQGKRRLNAGIVGFRDGTVAFELSMGLGEKAEVYDGEMAALAMGATKASNHAKGDDEDGITVLSEFIENSGAFTQSGEQRSGRPAPVPEEEIEREWWEDDEHA
ncbi:hypothetical protein IW262DRAFT_1293732 [Armillaria fumosa]|nr:hypothetical protein IW262DRAFT_1293732 [Armillaria fumosa]